MSIINKYPDKRPKGLINFIGGKRDLPVQVEFSRASTGTYVDTDGVLREVGNNVPRFTYNYDGTFKGMTVEGSATNIQKETNSINDASASYRVYGTETLNAAKAPDGTNTATKITLASKASNVRPGFDNYGTDYGNNKDTWMCFSVFWKPVKNVDVIGCWLNGEITRFQASTKTFIYGPGPSEENRYGYEEYKNGWFRLWWARPKYNVYSYWSLLVPDNYKEDDMEMHVWGCNLIEGGKELSSYIPNNSSSVASTTRSAESFKLVGLNSYSDGYSILADLDTEDWVTDIIEVQDASNTEQASITVNNGSLVYKINGKSLQSQNEYPQIGYVKGRFRALTAFGKATGSDVSNSIYTSTESASGVSSIGYPTTATVLPNAAKLEFGKGIFIKAIYFWSQKLGDTESMSLVKGDLSNILGASADIAKASIFVYDTDPGNDGTTAVNFNIKGTTDVKMHYGDGKVETTKVDPIAHTYPYAGKYKVQVETPSDATNGLSKFNLSTPADSTLKVLQWGEGYKKGASGKGFTGDQLKMMFKDQHRLTEIADFHYSDLTDLESFMEDCFDFNLSDTTWVPTTLNKAVTLRYSFRGLGKRVHDNGGDAHDFPKLTTSSAFNNAYGTFREANIKRFDGSNTGVPFTNVDGVISWQYTFYYSQLTHIGSINYSAKGTKFSMYRCFAGCSDLESWVAGDTSKADDMREVWSYCSKLTTFPSIKLDSCSNLGWTWSNCSELTTIGLLDLTGTKKRMDGAFYGCEKLNVDWSKFNFKDVTNLADTWCLNRALTGTFPLIDCTSLVGSLGSATAGRGTWRSTGITGAFPKLNLSGINGSLSGAWAFCTGLTSFPGAKNSDTLDGNEIDFSNVTSFGEQNQGAWQGCTGLKNFPMIDTSSGTVFRKAWFQCSNIDNIANGGHTTSFPKIDTSNAVDITDTWNRCSAISVFPAIDTSKVTKGLGSPTSASGTWRNLSKMTSFPALDLSNVEGDISGAWAGCSGLTSFPDSITLEKVPRFGASNQGAWQGCSSLTSFGKASTKFPKGVTFYKAWAQCTSLTDWKPTGAFDDCDNLEGSAFTQAFLSTPLSADSIERILTSCAKNSSNGVTLDISGGASKSTWSNTANTAYTTLTSSPRNWNIIHKA